MDKKHIQNGLQIHDRQTDIIFACGGFWVYNSDELYQMGIYSDSNWIVYWIERLI